jgi:hypothetical protein
LGRSSVPLDLAWLGRALGEHSDAHAVARERQRLPVGMFPSMLDVW